MPSDTNVPLIGKFVKTCREIDLQLHPLDVHQGFLQYGPFSWLIENDEIYIPAVSFES